MLKLFSTMNQKNHEVTDPNTEEHLEAPEDLTWFLLKLKVAQVWAQVSRSEE